jgi:hypothetical protein
LAVLRVDRDVLPATFAALRRCGGGERECVVYWLGPADESGRVDGILQPPHTAELGGYEVDSTWVTDFFLELRVARRSVRAQVHTHPGASVRHSPTDDGFAIVPSPGFVSLVVPHFAVRDISLDGMYAAVVTEGVGWVEQEPVDIIQWT